MSGRNPPGWFWPTNSRKAHYFVADHRSLCGKWLLMGGNEFEPDTAPSPDDCKACRAELTKRQAETLSRESVP
jgi:hypothetical protein